MTIIATLPISDYQELPTGACIIRSKANPEWGTQGIRDHYRYETEMGTISGVITHRGLQIPTHELVRDWELVVYDGSRVPLARKPR